MLGARNTSREPGSVCCHGAPVSTTENTKALAGGPVKGSAMAETPEGVGRHPSQRRGLPWMRIFQLRPNAEGKDDSPTGEVRGASVGPTSKLEANNSSHHTQN